MIYIIHGEDSSASYSYLTSILSNFKNNQKIYLETENTPADLESYITAQNIFQQGEIIICDSFISDKKIKLADIKNIKTTKTLIFFEQQKVNLAPASKIDKVSIMEFKLPATIFHFLDSIFPKSIVSLIHLKNIKDKTALNWHLANRLVFLILAKLGLSQDQTQTITKKPIADWQWQKITKQAESFEKEHLEDMLNAILAIDLMKKQGKTQASDQNLIALLLFKYLKLSQVIQ